MTGFHYGKFQRVIPLSAQIQNTHVTAEYKDGILNLTLPKTQQEKNKVVKVNIEQAAVYLYLFIIFNDLGNAGLNAQ